MFAEIFAHIPFVGVVAAVVVGSILGAAGIAQEQRQR